MGVRPWCEPQNAPFIFRWQCPRWSRDVEAPADRAGSCPAGPAAPARRSAINAPSLGRDDSHAAGDADDDDRRKSTVDVITRRNLLHRRCRCDLACHHRKRLGCRLAQPGKYFGERWPYWQWSKYDWRNGGNLLPFPSFPSLPSPLIVPLAPPVSQLFPFVSPSLSPFRNRPLQIQSGICRSAVSSPSRIWGGVAAEALKYVVWWHKFY